MDFLTEIMALKKARLEQSKRQRSAEALRAQAIDVRRNSRKHALRLALDNRERLNVIAEFKRASPSKGAIRAGAVPAPIALAYEAGGAAAISVLTEEDRFQGALDDLRAVRAAVKIPALRKDFIFDEYQIYESAEAGADALLLIVAALDDETLNHLRRVTEDELGMDALIEVHTEDEMRRAASAGARLIGINNRNLRTFEVSLDASTRLIQSAPPDALCISESGLSTGADLRRLHALGYAGFLIGETLMRSPQPDATLRALLKSSVQ